MKNLFIISVFLPFFSFSQVLIEKVSVMSYLDIPKNIHKSTQVMSNMSICIDSNFLIIKDDLETLKYKILKTHIIEKNGEKINVYEVLINKEKHLASVAYYKKSKCLILESLEDTDSTLFYQKWGF